MTLAASEPVGTGQLESALLSNLVGGGYKIGISSSTYGISDLPDNSFSIIPGLPVIPREGLPVHVSSFDLNSSPNPFNSSATISYELRYASYVTLHVYDATGRLVAKLVDGWRQAGAHQITFDGSDLPSGIYFARLTAASESGTTPTTSLQKLALVK